MIISQQKALKDICASLKEYKKIFLVGCGECAAACKSGGEPEVAKMQQLLQDAGKLITGVCIPSATCIASKLKAELAKNINALRQSEAVLILACGLGVQSFRDNDRLGLTVLPALDTLSGAVMDGQGNFFEKCSMCAECVLGSTAGICPITLCPKSLLNGPCGGVSRGKCEVDQEKDCVWVTIYEALDKENKLDLLKEVRGAKDFKKSARPHQLIIK
jgi:ferredoxin